MLPEQLRRFLTTPGRALLIRGSAGTGKTLLCADIARFAEAEDRPLTWMATRSMDPVETAGLESVVPEGQLHTWPIAREGADAPAEPASDAWLPILEDLIDATPANSGAIIIVDSLDGVMQGATQQMADLVEGLKGLANRAGATVVTVLEADGRHSVDHLVDGVVHLAQEIAGDIRVRTMEIQKLRGTELGQSLMPFSLANGEFAVPRTSALNLEDAKLRPNPASAPSGRLATAVHEWDIAADGGLRRGHLHQIRCKSNESDHAALLLAPMLTNELAQGSEIQLVGLSWGLRNRLQKLMGAAWPDAGSRITVVPGPSNRQRDGGLVALLAKLMRIQGRLDKKCLVVLDMRTMPPTSEVQANMWDELSDHLHESRHTAVLLAAGNEENGMPEFDSSWVIDERFGHPIFWGTSPRTSAYFVRASTRKGFLQTHLDVIA